MAVLLKYHQNLEHGGNKSVCTICGKAVTKMDDHIQRAHSSETNYHCDMCHYKGRVSQKEWL